MNGFEFNLNHLDVLVRGIKVANGPEFHFDYGKIAESLCYLPRILGDIQCDVTAPDTQFERSENFIVDKPQHSTKISAVIFH